MAYNTIKNRETIRKLIDYLILGDRKIMVRFDDDQTQFTSRIILARYGEKASPNTEERPELIIDRLDPEEGNALLQSSSRSVVQFSVDNRDYAFESYYIASTDSKFSRLIISFPRFVRVSERRDRERGDLEIPRFVSASFTLKKKGKGRKKFEVDVADYSANGVGLLVTEKDSDLINLLEVGDRLEDLQLYAKWTTANVSGTVVHKTKLGTEGGEETQLVGIRLDDVLE